MKIDIKMRHNEVTNPFALLFSCFKYKLFFIPKIPKIIDTIYMIKLKINTHILGRENKEMTVDNKRSKPKKSNTKQFSRFFYILIIYIFLRNLCYIVTY